MAKLWGQTSCLRIDNVRKQGVYPPFIKCALLLWLHIRCATRLGVKAVNRDAFGLLASYIHRNGTTC